MASASQRLAALPLQNAVEATTQIRALNLKPEEFAPAYKTLASTDRTKANVFAVAYVKSIESHDQLALHFDQVARQPEADRLAILAANRDGGTGIGVIHAASLLPAAQGQVLMKGFFAPQGQVIDRAAQDFAAWLQSAGVVMRQMNLPIPDANPAHDGFWDDLWNDTVGKVVDAVKSGIDAVVHAVGDIASAIASAIKDIAKWTAAQVTDFVRAVLTAGKAIADLVVGALKAGYAALKTIVQGIL